MSTTQSLFKREIQIPTVATIRNLEKAYEDIFIDTSKDPDFLLLDFKNCEFIEVTSLVWLISIFKYRKNKALETKIILPERKKVRDFFRVWRFPDTLSQVTETHFIHYVEKDSQKWFGENRNPGDLHYGGRIIDSGLNRLLSDRFFSCLAYSLNKISSREIDVLTESEKFNTTLITSVLAKQLQGNISYVSSRIIFESIMNAIRHPNASYFVIASFMDGLDGYSSRSKKHFTINIWDDGRSMVDTLADALNASREIRVESRSELNYSNFKVIFEESGVKSSSKKISSSYTPKKDTDRRILLLSTVFPGITCDTAGKGHRVHPSLQNEQPTLTSPGMGLHVLLNAVVDVFGGELAFRSDMLFMNIKTNKSTEQNVKYNVKIKTFNSNCPKFLGNMVTIRLPLVGEN